MSDLLRRVNLDSNEPVNFVCYHPFAEQKLLKGEYVEPACLAVEYEYESILHEICCALGYQGGTRAQIISEIMQMREQIRLLRAVIAEIPENFTFQEKVNGFQIGEYEITRFRNKLQLLKKHGVEV